MLVSVFLYGFVKVVFTLHFYFPGKEKFFFLFQNNFVIGNIWYNILS